MSIGLYSDPSVARGFIQVNGSNAVEIAPAAIRLPAGSVSAPSITASGDVNNGIYFPAADIVAITTDGTKRFEVSSSGVSVTGNLVVSSTGALTVPVGTTEQRPSPAASGMIRFNTSTSKNESYDGSQWKNIGSGENITAADDTSTNASYYPVMVSDSGSEKPSTVSKSKLSFNPSTGTLTTVVVTTTSDVNLKTNIDTITDALDIVLQLRGTSFTWKDSNQNSIGLIAQEVEKVLPEVVSTSEENVKSIAYGNVVGVLIEAIKEQQKLITDLADQVKNLKELH